VATAGSGSIARLQDVWYDEISVWLILDESRVDKMISAFRFKTFKSFVDAKMPVEALTILIGANASGKSNAVDGMEILSGLVTNREIGDILDGVRGYETGARGKGTGIRGGSRGAPRYNNSSFQLGCTFDCDSYYLDYEVRIRVKPHIWLENESLYKRTSNTDSRGDLVYKTEPADENSGNVYVTYNNRRRGRNPQVICLRNYSVLSQIPGRFPSDTPAEKDLRDMFEVISGILRNILILNPVPQLMRDYVHSSKVKILPTGENLSAVVAELISSQDVKRTILTYLQDYPEEQITDIHAINTPTGDVMLTFTEEIGKGSRPIDIRGMSDGTLRFLTILTALVGEKAGSTVIIEEVDNGLHPSRANKLVVALRELGKKRNLDLIVTTHNPAILNALSADDIPGVVVCYRDAADGSSRFVSWVDLPDYPELMARGGIGDIISQGFIAPEPAFHRKKQMLEWAKRRLDR